MLAVSVELLHGTFRADPDGSAGTGRLGRGEWPPAPARLLAALVAADGTGARCRGTDGSELAWFEALPPPVIYAHGAPWHQDLEPRFVVKQHGGAVKSTYREYVGRAPVEVRPGVRVTPRWPRIVYLWQARAPGAMLAALRYRAARIGYLGAADSPVRVRVETQPPDGPPEDPFVAAGDGDVPIRVSAPGDVALLDGIYHAWCEHGAEVARSRFPGLRHEQWYRSPRFADRPAPPVAAWLRLAEALPGRRVAALTALFKRAVLRQYEELFGEPPAVLHGHGFPTKGFELARYLALADAGYARSTGRIHGLALWLPSGLDSGTRLKARDAACALRRLTGGGLDVSVAPREDEPRPWAAHPDRWCGSARRWATVFPAIHERRGRLDLAELTRWCRHAGLPGGPVAFRTGRAPLVRGGIDLAPPEVNRPGRLGQPGLLYSHLELLFEEPVAGPVVIGAGRQRGFGLCVPVSDKAGPG